MLMNTRLTPSVDEAPCCYLWHRRNPTAPLLPLPTLENVAHLPHSSSSTSSPVALHYFIITIKVTKEKAITKSRAWIHIVGWASQNSGKRLVKQEEQASKFLSSFLPYPNHLPKGVMDASWLFAWKYLLTQRCISVTCWSTSKEGSIRCLSKNNWITNPKYLDL